MWGVAGGAIALPRRLSDAEALLVDMSEQNREDETAPNRSLLLLPGHPCDQGHPFLRLMSGYCRKLIGSYLKDCSLEKNKKVCSLASHSWVQTQMYQVTS